jgi:hypothetical protein
MGGTGPSCATGAGRSATSLRFHRIAVICDYWSGNPAGSHREEVVGQRCKSEQKRSREGMPPQVSAERCEGT